MVDLAFLQVASLWGAGLQFERLLQDLSVQGILGELDRIWKSHEAYVDSNYLIEHCAEWVYA